MNIAFIPKNGNREIWEISVDGDKWREVHRTIFGSKPQLTVDSENDLQAAFDRYEFKRAKNYVLWRLSKQSYHTEQMAKLLKERRVSGLTIEKVLQSLQESALFDDENWLKTYVQSQLKQHSLPAVLLKLRKKGFSAETLQTLKEEDRHPEEELATLLHLLKTRYRSKNLHDFKQKQKVTASLLRKGFSFASIKEAFAIVNN